MSLALALPSRRRGQKLAFSFDEDELTLAWEAVRLAGLRRGDAVAAAGLAPPRWWWQGTGLAEDPAAPRVLRAFSTTVGPAVAVHPAGAAPDVEEEARRLHAARPDRPEAEWQAHRLARDAPDTEADHPLGAFVAASRHEEVLAGRMAWPTSRVASWTRIEAGAAPTEFARLQAAVGAYAVVLVEAADGRRTVGLWAGDREPRTGDAARPVLRRLFRQQGAWRHGVKFEPA